MNRTDLEDLKEFDGLQALFSNAGMFFFAGAFWIAFEQTMAAGGWVWTPLTIGSAISMAAGLILAYAGNKIRSRKIGRIDRIFSETIPFDPNASNITAATPSIRTKA